MAIATQNKYTEGHHSPSWPAKVYHIRVGQTDRTYPSIPGALAQPKPHPPTGVPTQRKQHNEWKECSQKGFAFCLDSKACLAAHQQVCTATACCTTLQHAAAVVFGELWLQRATALEVDPDHDT